MNINIQYYIDAIKGDAERLTPENAEGVLAGLWICINKLQEIIEQERQGRDALEDENKLRNKFRN